MYVHTANDGNLFYGSESDAGDGTAGNNDAVDEAADDNDVDNGTGANITPPPVNLLNKDALQSIRGFTKERGYALAKLRSQRGKDGEINKVCLQCDGSKYRASHVEEQTGGESNPRSWILLWQQLTSVSCFGVVSLYTAWAASTLPFLPLNPYSLPPT